MKIRTFRGVVSPVTFLTCLLDFLDLAVPWVRDVLLELVDLALDVDFKRGERLGTVMDGTGTFVFLLLSMRSERRNDVVDAALLAKGFEILDKRLLLVFVD